MASDPRLLIGECGNRSLRAGTRRNANLADTEIAPPRRGAGNLSSDPLVSTVQNIAVPPHNLEAEKSVLGAVLLDERHLHSLLVEEQLRPEHFYREQHGWVFAAMLELYESDRKIDHLTVSETMRQRGKLEEAGGPAAIDELAGWVPAAGHAREYGRIAHDNFK